MKYLFILMLLFATQLRAQQSPRVNTLTKAKIQLDPKHPAYNPEKAFDAFSKLAAQGNAEAMNALGMLYMQGLGVTENDSEAISWFEKAALAGYGKAWYNWGTMYKNGDGKQQDFKKACVIFEQGAIKGFPSSLYALGYMYYHGLGRSQDYEKAVALFKQGIAKRNISAMYMLGLCYRNGYGTIANADSARYWLSLSYEKGYKQALNELKSIKPENVTPTVQAIQKNRKVNSVAVTQASGKKSSLNKIAHNVKTGDLNGNYTGYIIRYDWSGQHIISKSKLNLNIRENGGKLTGEWIEADTLSANLNASISDSILVFNNMQYQRSNHYSPLKPYLYEFKDASLQVLHYADSVAITGNVRLWNIKTREPENPVYVSLVKETEKPEVVAVNSEQTLLQKEFVVYPNPFNDRFTIEFYLPQAATVEIRLSDLNGRNLYQKSLKLEAGANQQLITANVAAGGYLLSLKYKGISVSRIVIKQ